MRAGPLHASATPALRALQQKVAKTRCKTRFKLLSGHGFNRAEYKGPNRRLQPLRATHAPQGLKPAPSRLFLGTTKVVP